MAKKERKKLPERVALEEFDRKFPNELTEAQEKKRDELVATLRAATFKNLAEARATRAMNALEALGNLSNRRRYAYTPAQVKTLQDAITAEGSKCFDKFAKALAAPASSGSAKKAAKRIEL